MHISELYLIKIIIRIALWAFSRKVQYLKPKLILWIENLDFHDQHSHYRNKVNVSVFYNIIY